MSIRYADQRKTWIRSRRQRRKAARRARLNRQVVRYLALVLLMTFAWCGFSKLPWTLKHGADDIIVQGNKVTTTEQVRSAIKGVDRVPLFRVDPRKLEQKIAALPDVKYAFVRRVAFPEPQIVVQVLEEFPWASYSSGPDEAPTHIISQSGRLIPIKEFPSISKPTLTIYGPANIKLRSKDVAQWSVWTKYVAAQTHEAVTSVDLRKGDDVRIQDGDLCLKVGLADSSLTKRLGRLASVMTAIEPLRDRVEYVNLALDNNIPLKVAKKADGAHTAMTTHSI